MTDFSQGERLQLAYLEAEFACVDLLLRREVRRWEIAGQDPNDDYRGLYITQAEAIQLLDLPFGVSWGQSIELAPEEEAAFKEALAQARHTADQLAGTFTKEKITPRLLQVASAFGLDRTELDILLLCLAPAFATRYERVYGYLQDNVTRRRPTVRLILQLLGEARMAQYALAHYLSQDAPLFRHRLLEYVVEAPPANVHWINQTLQVDEGVVAWLRGEYQAHSLLGEFAKLQQRFEKGLKGKQDAERLDCIPTGTVGTRSEPVWIFYGVDSERQQVVAEQMAAEAGQSLLTVQLNKVVNESCPPLQAVRLALRDARLTGSIPLLSGWDACLSSEDTVEPTVLRELCAHSGMVVVAGQRRWQPGGVSRQRPFFQRVFELPKYEERFALWQHYLEMQEHTVTLSELSELAAQFTLSSRQISDAIAAARDNALQRGRDTTIDELYASARSYSNPRLTTYARKITPRFGWDDIILPADEREKLYETVTAIRHRNKVLDDWGLGEKLVPGRGVMMLFAGPPGTGKTMAAEVVAGELRQDLYKIDLSGVVNKYIGETEKNLERIFSEASNSNAILFFDEADAIFGKRSEVKDAHDRYANLEIAYLLQRMESYDGITILATNMRANLDEAFLRRFHSTVDFPFPKRAERLHIWQTLFPPKVAKDGSVNFELLASRFELAGGNIRNIIVNAAYLAANNGNVVTMEHLLHGARREMQKMGRLVGEME